MISGKMHGRPEFIGKYYKTYTDYEEIYYTDVKE